MSSCPSEASLVLYAEQGLEGSLRASVEHHVAQCERCHLAVTVLRTTETAQSGSRSLSDRSERFASSRDRLERFDRRARLARALAPGASLGRFRVLGPIGRGAMGIVVAAYDPELDRNVAIKVLLDEGAETSSAAARDRMLREARSMAKLNHPNVVTAYETGVADGHVFLAMELVEGTTLKGWLTGRPDERSIVRLFARVAEAVDSGHRAGVIHRDLKPQNILVCRRGTPKVTDFGLAALCEPYAEASASSSASTTHFSVTGAVGTPAYMDPDTLAGGRPSPASDQFALAICLHEALTGRRPYDADTLFALRRRVIEGRPSIEASLPRALVRILERALARDPRDRFPTLGDLGDALDGFADRREDAPRERRRSLRAAAVTLVALGGAGIAAVVIGGRPPFYALHETSLVAIEASLSLLAAAAQPPVGATEDAEPLQRDNPRKESTPDHARADAIRPAASAAPPPMKAVASSRRAPGHGSPTPAPARSSLESAVEPEAAPVRSFAAPAAATASAAWDWRQSRR